MRRSLHPCLFGSALLAFLATTPALATSAPLAPIGVGAPPPAAPIRPVTETLWGVKVTDNYRYMEKLDPATLAWMKAQGAYTRKVLDAIAPLAALRKRVSAFTGSFGFVHGFQSYGGRDFYKERAPGSDDYNLMVRDTTGTHRLVDIATWRARHGGKPYAINDFLASPDGSKVAVTISEGGSENESMWVYDVASGKPVAGPIDRVLWPTGWSADSGTLFFKRLQKLAPHAPNIDKYKHSTADAWRLGGRPTIVAGGGIGSVAIGEDEFPRVQTAPGATDAMLVSIYSVQNEWKIWTAPRAVAVNPRATWKLLADRDAGVTDVAMRGNEIFLLSHKNAPTFKVLQMRAGASLASATTLVPAQPERVIEAIHAASDALYVLARKGAYSQLLRVPANGGKIESITLPFAGHIGEAFTDPRKPGITLELSSWVVQPTLFRYVPVKRKFVDLKIGHPGDMDAAAFKVSDLEAKAHDGVKVPLTLIQPKAARGSKITLLYAYGAYGDSLTADFGTKTAAELHAGITFAVCHVRGGGEKGEAWRLGGKDANKHNSWQDLIACGEDLIARGVTAKDKLFILSGSAGGVTVGRAMTARPDLFAGVLDLVPVANTLRTEFSPNGHDNISEYGSVTTKQGFKDLYAMDSIQHVKKGVVYPAVMITTGLNDPRVSPWEPAKFAAALQASGTPDPVLLRVEPDNGHGIGSNRGQVDTLLADEIAFIFWRAGKPGWRPDATH